LAENVGHLLAAALRHLARTHAAPEGLEGGPDHVVGVRGANRLGHHVLHAERLEHRAHRPPAMIPVPTLAERSITRPEPKCPLMSWCRVRPSRSGTRIICLLA